MVQGAQKYDRQLRIWGEHGQGALEHANVCLFNGGPTGTEALKNLVLAGVAAVTVVDGATVTPRDLGNNFFVDPSSVGKPRAKVVASLLQELNDSCSVRFVEEHPHVLLAKNPEFFRPFNLIICTQATEQFLVKVEELCAGYGCTLLAVRSYGLFGTLRISGPEHCVVESKPDSTVDDLRLHRPWPELLRYADTIDIDVEDSLLHSHIPYALVLLHVAREWRQAGKGDGAVTTAAVGAPVAAAVDGIDANVSSRNSSSNSSSAALAVADGSNGNSESDMATDSQKEGEGRALPATSAERSEFKKLITSHLKSHDEENYKEALASAFKVWSPPTPAPELSAILDDKAISLTSSSSDFWFMAAALKEFIANEGGGELPLDGAIPDMHALTDLYVGLQRVYQQKAQDDTSAVQRHVTSLLRSLGRDTSSIPPSAIKAFCKNARHLQVVRFSSLRDEIASPSVTHELTRMLSSSDLTSAAAIYLFLRAADQLHATSDRFPGSFPGEVDEEEVDRLKASAAALISGKGRESPGVGPTLPDDLAVEVCRSGACELHCIASVMGGIASQEAIKLITKQFVPISGTLVYDAINCSTTILSFKL